jgi:hypothetical protein
VRRAVTDVKRAPAAVTLTVVYKDGGMRAANRRVIIVPQVVVGTMVGVHLLEAAHKGGGTLPASRHAEIVQPAVTMLPLSMDSALLVAVLTVGLATIVAVWTASVQADVHMVAMATVVNITAVDALPVVNRMVMARATTAGVLPGGTVRNVQLAVRTVGTVVPRIRRNATPEVVIEGGGTQHVLLVAITVYRDVDTKMAYAIAEDAHLAIGTLNVPHSVRIVLTAVIRWTVCASLVVVVPVTGTLNVFRHVLHIVAIVDASMILGYATVVKQGDGATSAHIFALTNHVLIINVDKTMGFVTCATQAYGATPARYSALRLQTTALIVSVDRAMVCVMDVRRR